MASTPARRSTPPTSATRRPARPSTPPDAVRRLPPDAEQRKRAQQQLESVSVEVLLKQKGRLQAELDKLEHWRASVGSSFQVAWQEERAAHQRDLNEITRDLGASQDLARRLQLELERERSERATQHLAAKHAIARAQADTLAARKSRESLKQNGGEQLKAMQRQLARLRAEKAALQHELAEKPVRHVAMPAVAAQGGDELLQRAAASCASYHQLSIFQQPAADTADTAADTAAAAAFERLTAPPSPQLSGLHFLRLPGSAPKAAAGGAAEAEQAEGGARVLDLPGEAAMLFERFEAVSPGGRSEGRQPRRAAERAESLRRAGAPANQQGAIDAMKVSQQLRKVEAELDKVQRLHLAKSRRLIELEQEVESYHGGLESRAHEVERIGLERDAAQRTCEEGARQAEQLQQTIAELLAAVQAREDETATLRLEHMKLKNHIETLESSSWSSAAQERIAGASVPSWRPPRHPDLPSFDALWHEIAAAGGETMRSDTTLSVGEWPEELRM